LPSSQYWPGTPSLSHVALFLCINKHIWVHFNKNGVALNARFYILSFYQLVLKGQFEFEPGKMVRAQDRGWRLFFSWRLVCSVWLEVGVLMGGLVGAKPGREVEAKWWNAWNSRPQSLDLILRCHHNQQELLELLEGNKGWVGCALGT
jgi:hypothetical protein